MVVVVVMMMVAGLGNAKYTNKNDDEEEKTHRMSVFLRLSVCKSANNKHYALFLQTQRAAPCVPKEHTTYIHKAKDR